jgi:hypothetical protein
VAFGRYGAFPFRFGGGQSFHEIEHLAMLEALAPGYDIDEDQAVYAEVFAHARAVSMVWAINARVKNQALPLRMLENLTTWEEATGMRPGVHDLSVDRRRRVAAKLRGIAGNALADIVDTCTTIMGANFDTIVTVAAADVVVYGPGGVPGPPGFEFSSNRTHIGVRVTQDGLSTAAFTAKVNDLIAALDAMLPVWMTFQVGVGSSGFICDVGICDLTFL